MTRRANVAKVQIARKDLGLDDVAYRLMLERLTGHTSSADCTDAQLGLVLDEMKAKGWTPKVVTGGRIGRRARPVADHPSAKKARALWLSLWHLGEVRDPSEPALEAFARRQLGVEQLQWADQAQCYKLIEALKAMAERAGWSQDTSGLPRGTDLVKVLKVGLLRLQAKRLGMRLAIDRQPGAIFQADHSALDQAIRSLGDQIRAAATADAG
ncbi:gp16 family protein [Brevundimonas sp.]|uniref:gp16 family protein n=1 Tax=Brevundimonas sp. TaxID=1871086 RepID=UPI003D6C9921